MIRPDVKPLDAFEQLTIAAQAYSSGDAKKIGKVDQKWGRKFSQSDWGNTLLEAKTILVSLYNAEKPEILTDAQMIPFKAAMTKLHSQNTKNFFGQLFTTETNDDLMKGTAWKTFNEELSVHETRAREVPFLVAATSMELLVAHDEKGKFGEFYKKYSTSDKATARELATFIDNLVLMYPNKTWLSNYQRDLKVLNVNIDKKDDADL